MADSPIRYQPALTVSWNDAAAELVLYDKAEDSYHALNASGSAIWRALAVAGTVEGAIAMLVSPRPADANRITADVRAFLVEVLDRDLIVEAR